MLLIIIIAAILFLLLVTVGIFNYLIRKRNAVDNAFYSVDVMLRKRYDLIPQLVETVKGYMQHEKDVLTELTELRRKAMTGSPGINERVSLDNRITGLLDRIYISFENYPQLKSSENFLRLQGAINETEEQLAASRRFYNAAVTEYHNALQSFPSGLVARLAGMQERNWFESSPDQQQVPPVNFP